MRSGWQVEIRRGSSVERTSAPTREAALDAVEGAARHAARSERRTAVDLRVRTYAPGDQVVARIEIHGGGVRAGVDVNGDGSMTAHTGRIRRRPISLGERETPLAALRRTLVAD